MGSRSFIVQLNDCCSVGYIGNISVVSDLDGYVSCSVIRHDHNNCAVSLVNHLDVLIDCVDLRDFKCCMTVAWQIFAVSVISDVDIICSNAQVFYNQNSCTVCNRDCECADTGDFNCHIACGVNRNFDCDDFLIANCDVLAYCRNG